MVLTLLKFFLKLQYFFKKKIFVKITGFYFSEERSGEESNLCGGKAFSVRVIKILEEFYKHQRIRMKSGRYYSD